MSTANEIKNTIKEDLAKVDANSDGWITKEELFEAIGYICTKEEFEALFKAAEKNKHGEVSCDGLVERLFEGMNTDKGDKEGALEEPPDATTNDLDKAKDVQIQELQKQLQAKDATIRELEQQVKTASMASGQGKLEPEADPKGAAKAAAKVDPKGEAKAEVVEETAKLFRSLPLDYELAKQFAKELPPQTSPEDIMHEVLQVQDAHIDEIVDKASKSIGNLIKETFKKARDAKAELGSSGAARAAKFSGDFRGGTLDEFHDGVTKTVGEPYVDIGEGVRREHKEMQDSKKPFTTMNYGITTTPHIEYDLVVNMSEAGGDDVKVVGTRRCNTKGGQVQEDVRTLRPISYHQKTDTVVNTKLTWIEIVVVVLYTRPLLVLYNGVLRGFGTCGEVQPGVGFWSEDTVFEQQCKSLTVKERMKDAGHLFSSTIHALVSAIKKLQRKLTGVQGTWLYRGLGGLDTRNFLKTNGYTEKGFTSTTKEMKVALEYSGVKDGRSGAALAMEFSEVDQGAENQWRPLHYAAKNGHTDAVLELIKAGANVEATNAKQTRPLHLSAQNGHAEVVLELIEAKAELDAVQHQGGTALHLASFLTTDNAGPDKALEVVQTLLQAKAQIQVGKVNAIQLAEGKGYKDIVALLKEHAGR